MMLQITPQMKILVAVAPAETNRPPPVLPLLPAMAVKRRDTPASPLLAELAMPPPFLAALLPERVELVKAAVAWPRLPLL